MAIKLDLTTAIVSRLNPEQFAALARAMDRVDQLLPNDNVLSPEIRQCVRALKHNAVRLLDLSAEAMEAALANHSDEPDAEELEELNAIGITHPGNGSIN